MQSDQDGDQGGLARTRKADNGDKLSWVDCEGDVVESRLFRVGIFEADVPAEDMALNLGTLTNDAWHLT